MEPEKNKFDEILDSIQKTGEKVVDTVKSEEFQNGVK